MKKVSHKNLYEIPKRERWVFENKNILNSIIRGLVQSRERKLTQFKDFLTNLSSYTFPRQKSLQKLKKRLRSKATKTRRKVN